MAAGNDEFGGRLVLAGLLALGREAPWRHRVTAARGAALAAAMRVVDRVHGHAAIVRTPAKPARASGLADRDVHMVGIGYRTHRRHAAAVHQALLRRVETQDHIVLIAPHDLRIGPSRTGDLSALADLELDIVHDRADRHVAHGHRVAGLHVDVLAGHHRVARRHPLRRQDIGEFSVLVLDQRDEGAAVGVVFEALDLRRHVELAPLEVDAPVGLLVTAAAEAHGNAAVVVAPAGPALALGKPLHRIALVETGAVDEHQLTLAGGHRLVGLECHFLLSAGLQPGRHVDAVALFQGHNRLLDVRLHARLPRNALTFPLRTKVLTAFTLTS